MIFNRLLNQLQDELYYVEAYGSIMTIEASEKCLERALKEINSIVILIMSSNQGEKR